MAGSRKTRFTIYDVMESQGVFDNNAANSYSNDFKGPQQYPKMFYHPEGKERITQRAEIIATPMGPERVGELKEIINRVALDADEEAALRELGWHDHPAKAMKAAGKEMPPTVGANRESELEEQIRLLTSELANARTAVKPAATEDKYDPPPKPTSTLGQLLQPPVVKTIG
jgi:hypothetical protein